MKIKQFLLSVFAILLFAKTYAQAPLGIPYQAAARKANGQALTNTAIKVRFSILDSVATGAVAFKETHTTITNALGMFNLNVGMGTAITGTLSGVNWGNNAKFLQVELDTNATGNNYMLMGIQQLMSVPYALYSLNSSTAYKIKNLPKVHDTTFFSGRFFDFINSMQTIIIPENVYAIKVTAVGGGGGGTGRYGWAGGSGAYVKTIINIQPGDTLLLKPGFGGSSTTSNVGSASEIYINSQLILSAGGANFNNGGTYFNPYNINGIYFNGGNGTYGGCYGCSGWPPPVAGAGYKIEFTDGFGAGGGGTGSNGTIFLEY
jgi:hypothetical protein